MLFTLFNIFNLVGYRLYVIVIFEFYVVQMYEPGLGRHHPTKTRRVLGPDRAIVSTLWLARYDPKVFCAFLNRSYLARSTMGPEQPDPV
jgi:hypothetical protein